ncbi:MAG: GyrI-like domain-containing protein [Bdellovibrionota bacterium]
MKLKTHRAMPVLAFVALTFGIAITAFGDDMKPVVVNEKEFFVIGIEARTNNALEMTKDGVIPKQWGKFFKEGLLAKIPGKADSNILAVYTEYESDKIGDYTFVLGTKVTSVAVVPDGMVAKKIRAARYEQFTTETGPVSKVVPEMWMKIWNLEDTSQLAGRRAYVADYEVYDQRAQNPQSSQVDIYLGVR